MDMAAYEFVWKGEESLNPKEQAEIYAIYKNAGILTADEIRAELGRSRYRGRGSLNRISKTAESPKSRRTKGLKSWESRKAR